MDRILRLSQRDHGPEVKLVVGTKKLKKLSSNLRKGCDSRIQYYVNFVEQNFGTTDFKKIIIMPQKYFDELAFIEH